MLTTLILLLALAGLAVLVFLLLADVDESDTWMARTRRRLHRERVQLGRRDRNASPDRLRRERVERQRIEKRLEEERTRAALQDPD
jgi:hypothetical protein